MALKAGFPISILVVGGAPGLVYGGKQPPTI